MNLLQEHPHLFANGKFEAQDSYTDTWLHIQGIDYSNSLLVDEVGNHHPIGSCTLIARPIDDMTNDEFLSVQEGMSVLDLLRKEEFIKILSEQTETEDGLGLQWVKCLGDWGMYFGPQSHFKDGTVIDSRTL